MDATDGALMDLGLMMGLSRGLGAAGDWGRDRKRQLTDEEIRRQEQANRDRNFNADDERFRTGQAFQREEFDYRRAQGDRASNQWQQSFDQQQDHFKQGQDRQKALDVLGTLRDSGVGYRGDPMDLPSIMRGRSQSFDDGGGSSPVNPFDAIGQRASQMRRTMPATGQESIGELGDGFYTKREEWNPNTGAMGSIYGAGIRDKAAMDEHFNSGMRVAEDARKNAEAAYMKGDAYVKAQYNDDGRRASQIAAKNAGVVAYKAELEKYDRYGQNRWGNEWTGYNAPPPPPPPASPRGAISAPRRSLAPSGGQSNPLLGIKVGGNNNPLMQIKVPR